MSLGRLGSSNIHTHHKRETNAFLLSRNDHEILPWKSWFTVHGLLQTVEAVNSPWRIRFALKIQSVDATANRLALDVQSLQRGGIECSTHEFIGCYGVIHCSLCWRGETGGHAPDVALSHQRFRSLWLDSLSKISAYAAGRVPAKVLPIGPRPC